MERLIDFIVNQIMTNFDFSYMVVVNILTYLFIKFIDTANGDKAVSILVKRLMLIISIVLVTGVYILSGYDNKIVLLNSAIAAPVAWSWIFRPIVVKFGIGYKRNYK